MSEPLFDRRNPGNDPCADHEKRISLTEQAVNAIKQTNEGITTKLDLILAQITKVAILEERHNTQSIDISRARGDIEKLEEKHDALATEIRAFMNYTKGQNKILWALSAAVAGVIVKIVFFAANHGMTP